jgi:EmrB/QacA subfamily drug resistance transporter
MASPSRSTLLADPDVPTERGTNKWIVLALVCMAEFMVVLDATVVNVALPSIEHGLHFSMGDLQWIVNVYTLTFGGFLLLGGRAGDVFGRRQVFLLGLAIFTLASIFNGFATSSGMLIVGRAIQGLGGALTTPAALAIIVGAFEEGADRSRALGVWAGITATGGAIGLLVGGALTQAISWRWAFFINGPIGVTVWLLAARLVANFKSQKARGVDVLGAATVTAGLMALVYALALVSQQGSGGQPNGWTAPPVLLWGGIGIVLLAAFVLIESRSQAPIVPLSTFRIRSVSAANLAMLLISGAGFAMLYFLTLFMQQVMGFTPFQAGLAFLPLAVSILIGAGLASQLVRWIDPRILACVGLVLAAVGFLALTRIEVGGGYADTILLPLVVNSVGISLAFVPLTLIATTNVDAGDAGLASGLLNTSQRIGGSLGLAVLATLATAQASSSASGHPLDPAALVTGFHAAFVGGAVLVLMAAVLVAVFIRQQDVATMRERGQPGLEATLGVQG